MKKCPQISYGTYVCDGSMCNQATVDKDRTVQCIQARDFTFHPLSVALLIACCWMLAAFECHDIEASR